MTLHRKYTRALTFQNVWQEAGALSRVCADLREHVQVLEQQLEEASAREERLLGALETLTFVSLAQHQRSAGEGGTLGLLRLWL